MLTYLSVDVVVVVFYLISFPFYVFHFQWKCSSVMDGCCMVRKFPSFEKHIWQTIENTHDGFSSTFWMCTWTLAQGINIRFRCSVGIAYGCSWSIDWCCHFSITFTTSRQLCKYFTNWNYWIAFGYEQIQLTRSFCLQNICQRTTTHCDNSVDAQAIVTSSIGCFPMFHEMHFHSVLPQSNYFLEVHCQTIYKSHKLNMT